MTKFTITDRIIGTGNSVTHGALIIAHYTGYLADGTIFDSSHQRGQAFETVIGTGRVIKGWDLGVLGNVIKDSFFTKFAIDEDVKTLIKNTQAMQVGGVRELIVPAYLAYGERQIGKISPNSDLRFEIELLDIKTRDN